jgi:hypothetical protein
MLHSLFNAPRKYPEYYAQYEEKFNFYEGRDVWLNSIQDIPEKAVNLFSIHWLHLEVYNGTFWQYFFNSTSISYPEAVRGFTAIGMLEVAEIVEKASLRVGDPFPFEEVKRREIVGGPQKRMAFDDLTDMFYKLADNDKFFRRQPKFVKFADEYVSRDD